MNTNYVSPSHAGAVKWLIVSSKSGWLIPQKWQVTFRILCVFLLKDPPTIRSHQVFFAHVLKDSYAAFTLDVKSVLNENLGDILDGTQC
jgi:hypothetical protein